MKKLDEITIPEADQQRIEDFLEGMPSGVRRKLWSLVQTILNGSYLQDSEDIYLHTIGLSELTMHSRHVSDLFKKLHQQKFIHLYDPDTREGSLIHLLADIRRYTRPDLVSVVVMAKLFDTFFYLAKELEYQFITAPAARRFIEQDSRFDTDRTRRTFLPSPPKAAPEPEYMPISYTESDQTLHLGNIHINLQSAPNQANLCKILFRDKASARKSWEREEILREWGYHDSRIYRNDGVKLREENRLKVYYATEGVQEKVFKATKGAMPNLLSFSSKTVTVNSAYHHLLANT